MAQTKTSSGRGSGTAKKPTSTARNTGGTKKTSSASRGGSSSGRQTKKAPAKSSAARSGTSKAQSRSATQNQSASRGRTATPPPSPGRPIRREVGCVVLLFLGLIAVITYFPVDGWLVEKFRLVFRGLFGWGYYLVPVCLLWGALILGFHRGRPVQLRLICVLCMPMVFGALIHLLLCKVDGVFANQFSDGVKILWDDAQYIPEYCGGVVSGMIGLGLKKSISIVGGVVLCVAAFLLMMMAGLNLSVETIVDWFKNLPRLEYEPEPIDELDEDKFFSPEDYLFPMDGGEPIRKKERDAALEKELRAKRFTGPTFFDQDQPAPQKPVAEKSKQKKRSAKEILFSQFDLPLDAETQVAAALDARQAEKTKKPERKKSASTQDVKPLSVADAADIAGVEIHSADMDNGAAGPASGKKQKIDADAEAAIVAKEIEAGAEEDKPTYEFPPLDLLNCSGDSETYDADGDLDETELQLENAVRSFGVGASIVGAVHGPTITRYELKLDQGVKLNKITNLAGDIALSLGVKSVRIAPVPDKISTVGVEVPNKNVRTVWLGDLVDSTAFRDSKSKLSVALGKDIGGNVVVSNISKMPHLLIAGTTGSGKSVCVNSMILSLLYKSSPEEVRMIMIDPKMVEFVVYNGMPHLYVPVVTDAKKAAGALQWAVVEMLKRYRLFSETGVRELTAYNTIKKNQGEETLPQVVIFIDELADLMMVASKEVEEAICRVAQMGRAAGMHLVIATQSPRADVITGLMKANIPSRIALSVSGPLESRIILDQQGAEKLLGNGDMLYSPIGSKPVRVQGAFVTDEEREEIINFLKREAEAEYSDEILAEIEKASADKNAKEDEPEADASKSDYDELLPQAVDVIFETKQASVSMLQRRLKLGYSRAARLIDQLEEVGVVGPYEGSKPRKIMITKQQWQEMQYSQGTAPVDTIAQEFAEVVESDEFAPTDEERSDDVPWEEENPSDGETEVESEEDELL